MQVAVADGDPTKLDTLQRMTLLEYFHWCDQKIADTERQLKELRKRNV